MLVRRLKSRLHRTIEHIVGQVLDGRLDEHTGTIRSIVDSKLRSPEFETYLSEFLNERIRIWGDEEKVHVDPSASLANTLFNTSSGGIWVGEHTFTGHNVSILTGTHRAETFLHDRQAHFPTEGGDIRIGRGVWLGSNSIVLGPCEIGDHAVVAAGAVVTAGSKVPPGGVVMGVPGRIVRTIDDLPNE